MILHLVILIIGGCLWGGMTVNAGEAPSPDCIFEEDILVWYRIIDDKSIELVKNERIWSISIPSELNGRIATRIGAEAYAGNEYSDNVYIPETINYIGHRAFMNCSALLYVTIMGDDVVIEDDAFEGTSEYLIIYCNSGSSVETWAKSKGMRYLATPKEGYPSVTGETPDGLQYKKIADDQMSITGYTGNSEDIIIPEKIDGIEVTCIENFAFYSRTDIQSVAIPETVKKIGESAFGCCSNLTSINIPQNIIEIGDGAFVFCGFESVTIPANMTCTVYGENKNYFYGCANLKTINVDSKNPRFCSVDGVMYSKDMTEIVAVPGSVTEFEIPSGVVSIGRCAFADCSDLKSVTIPEGVVTIRGGAFVGCTSLKKVDIPEGVTDISTNAFYCCYGISTIKVPDSVNYISSYVFDSTTTILCYKGSYAESYAKDNNIPYKTMLKGTTFADVKEDVYYAEPVVWAYNLNVAAGTDEYSFSPGEKCNRAQAISFIWRLKGSPEPKTSSSPFTDVTPKKYYYKAVLWAYENKIASGKSSTEFDPKGQCTRAQYLTFYWSACGKPLAKNRNNPFVDVKSGKYYTEAVLWASENKIASGTDTTHFSPNAILNRGQSVTFLYRGETTN